MEIMALPRYVIENGIDPRTPYVVISITDPGSDPANIKPSPDLRGILRLQFWDLNGSRPGYERVFTEDDAREIRIFVSKHKDIGTIVCHCEAGISRSSGVAAALAKSINGDDSKFFSGRYRPNSLAYKTLLRELLAENR
jgi:predicted protein tyrosine phosphatase